MSLSRVARRVGDVANRASSAMRLRCAAGPVNGPFGPPSAAPPRSESEKLAEVPGIEPN